MNSKRKGTVGEREAVHFLNNLGFDTHRTSQVCGQDSLYNNYDVSRRSCQVSCLVRYFSICIIGCEEKRTNRLSDDMRIYTNRSVYFAIGMPRGAYKASLMQERSGERRDLYNCRGQRAANGEIRSASSGLSLSGG